MAPPNEAAPEAALAVAEPAPAEPKRFYVVSGAGSPEANGIFKNVDGNMNDNVLNYKMMRNVHDREWKTYKLYRSPSEDQSVRYWIIEERNKDYFYLVTCDPNNMAAFDFPPVSNWKLYGGKNPPPNISTISEPVENELRTRIENQDTLTTLDLINEYQGRGDTADQLKKAYMAIWSEQPNQPPRRASKDEKRKNKKKNQMKAIKPKVQINIQYKDNSKLQPLTVAFDSYVMSLKEAIAKQRGIEVGQVEALYFEGKKILSERARIDKLGISKGMTVVVDATGAPAGNSSNGNRSGPSSMNDKSGLGSIRESANEASSPNAAAASPNSNYSQNEPTPADDADRNKKCVVM